MSITDSSPKDAIPLITNGDQISTAWMRDAMCAGGADDWSTVTTIEVEKLSDATNAIGTLFRCRAIKSNGDSPTPSSVIVKLPTINALPLRFAKWLSMYKREYVFYKHVSPEGYVNAPRCFYGDFDDRSHDFVLLIEDLGDLELVSQYAGVSPKRALSAVQTIAEFQGQFWNRANVPALAHCGEFLSPGHRRIMQTVYMLTLPVALDRFGQLFSEQLRRLALDFGSRIDVHFEAAARNVKTVVHGDYRSENMLFSGDNAEDIVVIDWQGCGLGCGMFDVSYFLGTSVSVENRRLIEEEAVRRYHDAVCRAGAKGYTLEDCWHSYRQNMLGSLMHCVVGCGALDMSDGERSELAMELLRRILTAIEDLDAGALLPERARPFSVAGVFSILSKVVYHVLSLVVRPRRHNPA